MSKASFLLILSALCTACAADGPSLKTLQSSVLGRSPAAMAGDQSAFAVKKQALTISSRTPEGVSLSVSEQKSQSANSTMGKIPPGDLKLFPLFSSLGFQGEITALVVSRDGSQAYIGGSDGSVVASTLSRPDEKNKQAPDKWNISAKPIFESKRPVLALALSPDARFLAIAEFSAVFILDLSSQEISNVMTHVGGRVLSLAWDPRGELLLLGRASGEVFAWRLDDNDGLFSLKLSNPGSNSSRALEQYGLPGGSPIIRLAFHPSARAFISVSQDGGVNMWRLLRTEDELGLRDESAEIDEGRRGNKEVDVGRIGAIAGDFWLDPKGQEVFVSSVDGNVHRWKLRGLEAKEMLAIGADSVSNIQGVDLLRANSVETHYLFAAGRGQNIKLFCRETPDGRESRSSSGGVPIVRSDVRGAGEDEAGGTRIEDGRLIIEDDASNKTRTPAPSEASPSTTILVAESATLKEPFGVIRSGGPILWGTQKKGNLVAFNTRELMLSAVGKCPSSRTEKAEKKAGATFP